MLAGLDATVAPSLWYENSPLAIMEAHAAGRPVLTSALGGMAELVRDGVDGLLFPGSLAIVGDEMFVTNTALPLTPAVGDEPEEDVTRYTVSRIKLPGH